ncbi:MAG: helix-turn-helix transcriptional regulator [Acidimicrobiales bacterium]
MLGPSGHLYGLFYDSVVIGRGRERAVIEGLVAGARSGRSGVLVLHGEPGVGKSVLLGHGVGLAADFCVLRASGVETELDLAFAGLDQLVRPVLSLAERLAGLQADALLGALGLVDAVGSDRFLVAVATLSLLSEVAEDGPVLCVIDDAQWLDQSSSEALAFAARRLEAEGVVLLAATRDEPWPGLPALRIGGFESQDAGDLLRQRGGDVAPEVRARLVDETGGNPLALVELAGSLSAGQLAGADPLPRPVRLGSRVERAFLDRVRQLPEATQTLLLIAATDDTGDPGVIVRAAGELGVEPDALEAAERAGLAKVDDTDGIGFRHPLVRAAVYQAATFSARSAAHRALAGVLEGDDHAARRAWHRAATATGPDEAIARELERSGETARQRGAHAVASATFERAGELSAGEPDRARLLVAAAGAAFQAGQADRAAGLAGRAQPLVADRATAGEVAVLRGRIEFARGSAVTAHAWLLGAAQHIAEHDAQAATAVLVEAARAAWTANDPGRLVEATKQLAELTPPADDPLAELTPPADDPLAGLVSTTIAIADLFAGRTADAVVGMRRGLDAWRGSAWAGDASDVGNVGGVGHRARSRADDADDADHGDHDAALVEASLALVGYTRVTSDDAAGLALGSAVVAECRQRGWAVWLPWTLANLSMTEAVAGRHSAALVSATEGLQLARDLDQPTLVCRCESILVWLAAVRGDQDQCRELAHDTVRLAETHQLATIAVSATWALGLLDLSLGRPEQAFDRLADRTAGPLAVPHFVCLFLPDLLEAAARAGRTNEVGELVAWYEEWATATQQPVAQANLHRCQALLGDQTAEEHFGEALRLFEHAGPDQRPFDRARTQLLYGEWLRRARRRVEARAQLSAAHETFQRLGAEPWADRAAAELRATGQTLRRPDTARMRLTPQEMQVVRLVAQGGSNKDVAAKLFLSHRTVAYHLHKAYPKLGVTSRTELAHLDLDTVLTSEQDS